MAVKYLFLFSLALVVGCVLVQEIDPKNKVTLVTVDKPYEGSFTFTVKQFLTLPYLVDKSEPITVLRSSIFATQAENNFNWFFKIEPHHNDTKGVNVVLEISKLPSIYYTGFTGTVECSIIDAQGSKQYSKVNQQKNKISFQFNPLILRSELERKAKELLPNDNLSLHCDVEGVIVHNLQKSSSEAPTLAIKPPIPEVVNLDSCHKDLAVDTLTRLSIFDENIVADVQLKSGNKRFKCHKAILSERSFFFKSLFKKYINNVPQEIVYDMSDELNEEQLDDLIRFIYGMEPRNLNKTCPVLFVWAKKYQIACLRETCEKNLIEKVRVDNVLEYMKLSVEIGSQKLRDKVATCILYPQRIECRI